MREGYTRLEALDAAPLRLCSRWTVTTSALSSSGLILRAVAFAERKHRGQPRRDKDKSPYIHHPIAAANILANEGGVEDPVVLAAALLHDTIEDTSATPQELIELFGDEVAAIVLEVTDDKALDKAERKRLQIAHAAGKSHKAKLVKLADKTANLRDMVDIPPADWNLERRREYFDWAKQVIDEIRGTNGRLEAAFDAAYARKPAG
jgi:guanosine-3',5'-bis(diphosphate) 3'-pyrophosphohydrolase